MCLYPNDFYYLCCVVYKRMGFCQFLVKTEISRPQKERINTDETSSKLC